MLEDESAAWPSKGKNKKRREVTKGNVLNTMT